MNNLSEIIQRLETMSSSVDRTWLTYDHQHSKWHLFVAGHSKGHEDGHNVAWEVVQYCESIKDATCVLRSQDGTIIIEMKFHEDDVEL